MKSRSRRRKRETERAGREVGFFLFLFLGERGRCKSQGPVVQEAGELRAERCEVGAESWGAERDQEIKRRPKREEGSGEEKGVFVACACNVYE